MKVTLDDQGWLVVEFGNGFRAKDLDGASAIIDFSAQGLPAQIELVSLVDWAMRFCGEQMSIPSERDVGEDAWCLRYDRVVDCLMVYFFRDSRQLAPFRNREVPARLSVDDGGALCGVSVLLQNDEVAKVLSRIALT